MKNEYSNPQIPGPSSLYRPMYRNGADEYSFLPGMNDGGGYDGPGGPQGPQGPQGSTIREYLRAVKARKWVVVAIAFAGCVLGAAYAVVQPAVFRAFTTIEIHGLNENFMNFSQVDTQAGSGAYSATSSNIQTQMRILESMQLRERVIERLKLETMPPPPSQKGYVQRLRLKLGITSDNRIDAVRSALKMAIDTLKAGALRETRIIEIRCMSTSPEVAATYLNTLVSEYIEQTMELRSLNARRTSEWLVNQLEETRQRLQLLDGKLREFERTTGYTAASPQDTLAGSKSRQLQVELSSVQAERILKQSRWELARSSPPDSLPEIIDDAALRTRQTQILDLRKQIADLTTTLTPAHYQVKRVMAQLAQVEEEAVKDRKRVLDRISGEYDAALKREKMLGGAYNAQRYALSSESEKSTQHQMLVREREVAQQMHNAMLQQVNQASMAAAIPATQVRAIDRARPLYESGTAGPVQGVLMGGFCGLMLGVGFVVAREVANRTVRTPSTVTALLNVPELAVIPSLESAELLEAAPEKRRSGKELTLRAAYSNPQGSPEQGSCWGDRPTLLSESFRLALTSLMIANDRRGRCQALVITSPGPGEGKTFVTAHLGRAMAEAGRRALLVDMDLRRPALHKEFELRNTLGLGDLLRRDLMHDASALRDAIKPTGIPGLSILPAGRVGISNISHLMYNPKLLKVIEQFRLDYDFVLLDTPPMLPISDARALGRLSDGVLLVLRAGVTERDSAIEARRRLEQDGTPLIGTLLNDMTVTTEQNYFLYSAHYQVKENGV